jgi:glycosyltransferase involved in cell wall biosynthesis
MAGPRYSILLPTRQGGPFLDRCVASILGQTNPDFELVVADNANDDATPEILRAWSGDPRLRVVRSETVLSVTDNWTAALEASRGRYVLMVGDDDLLLPGCLSELDRILDRHGSPECVTFNGYRYVAPESVGRQPTSYYADPYFHYGDDLPEDGLVSPAERRRLVARFYAFDFAFPLTMQLTLVRRDAMARLPHGFFKSVFPDHYALCGLLLTAESWVLCDRPLVVVGVSPKSFGQYFFNDTDASGLEYLGVRVDAAGGLEGSPVLNAMYSWLGEALGDFRAHLGDLQVDRGAYVARQVRYWLRSHQAARLSTRELVRRIVRLAPRDAIAVARRYARPSEVGPLARAAVTQRGRRADHLLDELTPLPGVATIDAFAAWITGPQAARPTPGA